MQYNVHVGKTAAKFKRPMDVVDAMGISAGEKLSILKTWVGYTRESESGSSRLSVADPQVHRSTGRVPIRACRPGHGRCQAPGRDALRRQGRGVRTPWQGVLVRCPGEEAWPQP